MFKTKYFFLITIFILQANFLYAQNKVNLNQGYSETKKYFSTVPYTKVAGKILVEVVIGDKKRKFILDTGAPTSISENLSRELNSKLLQKIEITDQSGMKDSVNVVSLSYLKINDIVFRDTPAVAKNSKLLYECYGVDGIVGSNLLRNSVVQFNDHTKTVVITDDPKLLNFNRKDGAKMEVSTVQSNPYVWIKLRKGKAVANEKILFDTGDNEFYTLAVNAYEQISKQLVLFELIAQNTGSYSLGLHGSAIKANNVLVNIPQLEVNDMKFKNVMARSTYSGASRFGSGILKYGKVTLDYINKKFYIESFSNDPEIITKKTTWQIDPTLNNDRLVVGIIWDKSLEDKINVGDEIIRFDNIDYQSMKTCDLLTAEHNVEKQKAIIELKDINTGRIKEVEISKL